MTSRHKFSKCWFQKRNLSSENKKEKQNLIYQDFRPLTIKFEKSRIMGISCIFTLWNFNEIFKSRSREFGHSGFLKNSIPIPTLDMSLTFCVAPKKSAEHRFLIWTFSLNLIFFLNLEKFSYWVRHLIPRFLRVFRSYSVFGLYGFWSGSVTPN